MSEPSFVQELTASQRRLYGYILSLVPSPAEADDVLQETNLALWRKAADFQAGTSFLAWACRVAYFEVLNHYRKRKRNPQPLADEALLECVAQEARDQLDGFDERLTALRGCLERLSERKRHLLQRFYFDERSLGEIAVERGQSEGVIRVTVHRIRGVLLACIHRTLAHAGRT
jgi:RNA polymerase sigma-70 factor (ECF subfamily)